MRRHLLIGSILLAAVAAVFGQTTAFPFVGWDDPYYITSNATLQQGLTAETVAWALTDMAHASWHPVTWLSHLLDWELHGPRAGGHHLTSVVLHGLISLVVYGLFFSMTGAPWRSGAVALLFAIHPLHVEPVAWVSGRKELLSTLFGLLSAWAYVGYARRGGGPRYALVLGLFCLSLMSKAMLVTLPVLLLLLDRWPLGRGFSRRMVWEKVPMLVLSGAIVLLTYFTQRSAGAMLREDPLPLWARLANAVASYGEYGLATLWPRGLAVFHPHPFIAESGGLPLSLLEIGGFGALLLGVSVWVWRHREAGWPVVGWGWFLISLVPVIGIIQVGHQARSDRYMYLPAIGLFVLMVWTLDHLVTKQRKALLAATGVGFAALGAAAWLQTHHWRDTTALFQHAIDVVPRNPVMRFNVANHLRDAGDTETAIAHYRRVLEETPRATDALLNLANVQRRRGELEEAIALYERVLQIAPRHRVAHNNLGSAHRARGDDALAEHHFERALESGPDSTALYNLGNLRFDQDRIEEAMDFYRQALEEDPGDARIHNNLGLALLTTGRPADAAPHFVHALRLRPDHSRAAHNLGRAMHERGDLERAELAFDHALELDPDYASAHRRLASVLVKRGRPEEARLHFERALELDPHDEEARRGLASLQAGN